MSTGSNKKWIIVAAALILISVPAGLWVTRSSIFKGSDTSSSSTSETTSQQSSEQAPEQNHEQNQGNASSNESEVSQSDSGQPASGSNASQSKAQGTNSSKSDPTGAGNTTAVVAPAAIDSKGAGSTTGSSTGGAVGKADSARVAMPSAAVGAALPGAPSIPGKPGAPAAPGLDVARQGVKEATKEAEKAPEGCVTFAYRHKKTSGHNSDDACSHHKNIIQLKHAVAVNPSSICVRVNKRPVAFQAVKGHADQIMIGAVAGPDSDISVRYCLGKSKCAEDCSIAKDEFLSAIGGSEQAGGGQVAHWDPADAAEKEADVNGHLDKDIRNELERLDEARPDARLAAVFKDWVAGTEAPACVAAGAGERHARK